MPLFRPIDEMSLRHLFATNYAQEQLHLSYLGPVVNPGGAIETSPDCMILDQRKSPFRPRRCEFKFIVLGKEDFAHNGLFDIAVLWNLQKGLPKERLRDDLRQQNGCEELVILEEMKAFRDLPAYGADVFAKLGNVGAVRDVAIETNIENVFALCMAARLYPKKFNQKRMVAFLVKRFSEVKKMHPQGRGNVISKFLMTKPPLIQRMHGEEYRWTSEIDAQIAAAELTQLIRGNFEARDPTDEDLEEVLRD